METLFFYAMKKREHIFVTLVEGVWDKMKKFGEKKWLKVNWEGLYMFSNIKMMVAHKTLMMMLTFTYSKCLVNKCEKGQHMKCMSFLLNVILIYKDTNIK